jgi:hypothetical protein
VLSPSDGAKNPPSIQRRSRKQIEGSKPEIDHGEPARHPTDVSKKAVTTNKEPHHERRATEKDARERASERDASLSAGCRSFTIESSHAPKCPQLNRLCLHSAAARYEGMSQFMAQYRQPETDNADNCCDCSNRGRES